MSEAQFAYNWNSQAPPPINGQLRTDTRDWAGAAQVWMSTQTSDGVDVAADLAALSVGATIRAEQKTDATRFAEWSVAGAPDTADASSVGIPVTLSSSGGTLPNSGTNLIVTTLVEVPPDDTPFTFTYTLTTEQARGLRHVGGDDPEAYLQTRVSELLDSYWVQYNLATVLAPPRDVAEAYVMANPVQQKAAMDALGMTSGAQPTRLNLSI